MWCLKALKVPAACQLNANVMLTVFNININVTDCLDVQMFLHHASWAMFNEQLIQNTFTTLEP